jgi:hypothetical protein
MASFSKAQLQLTLHIYLCVLCPVFGGRELSAAVFGQHVHLILSFVIFAFGAVRRTKFTRVVPEQNN